MEKLIEVNAAREFASTFLADPILKMAVYAVLNNAPGFDLVRCKDCRYYNADGEYCSFWGACRHPEHYCEEGLQDEKCKAAD